MQNVATLLRITQNVCYGQNWIVILKEKRAWSSDLKTWSSLAIITFK